MKFEQALKLLAEKEPEKFEFKEYGPDDGDKFYFYSRGKRNPFWLSQETQDDIDEILALIGWAYEVRWSPSQESWWFILWDHPMNEREYSPTKLEAAKAALIAVVQRQYLKGGEK